MKEIYKYVLDKATLPKESKDNLKSLYDKVNQEDNVVSFEKKRNVKKPLAFKDKFLSVKYFIVDL